MTTQAGTRWELTAPESFVLLNGPSASGREAFKLGVMELIARGALAMDEAGTKNATLRDGPQARAPRERALGAIWDVYQASPSHSWAGRYGVRLKDLGRTAVKQYGSLDAYRKSEVLGAMVDRGLFERREGRILWIFPTTRFELTADGDRARDELQNLMETGRQRFSGWAADDPNQALAYAGTVGAAMLLMPMLYGDMAGLHERMRYSGAGADGGTYVHTGDSGDSGDSDFDFEFDWSGVDFGGLDFGGIDTSFSDSGGFGDGGGFGGDGGGGDGGGGGNGGGGGGE
jgi:Golgi phosphoprotein 3 (GPP34)